MDTYLGHLGKMKTTMGDPVSYILPLDDLRIPLNPHLGREIKLAFTGAIHCQECGRKIKKTYSEGHCWNCTQALASCDLCIMKPETCHYDQGTCREPAWGEANCMTRHYVYLANSSGLKVGITRGGNIPTRWIDQGAHEGIPIFKVATRKQSGLIETMFKQHVSDRTNWRKMLTNKREEHSLPERRDELMTACKDEIEALRREHGEDAIVPLTDEDVTAIEYPVLNYPEKVKSFNFTKTPMVEGVLQGIKGQYLLLSTGVLNIRKFTGFEVEVTL